MKWRLISRANTRFREIAFALVLAPSVLVQGYRQDVSLGEALRVVAGISRELARARPKVSVYQTLRAKKRLMITDIS